MAAALESLQETIACGSDDDEAPTLVAVGSPHRGEEATAFEPSDDLPPCPVTILSGFLGSGKTTLIQYILKSPDHGKRIAVIENEFGEGLAVESMIARDGVDNGSLIDLIELPNGCICCTVKDSLVSTLELLLQRRRDLDYILIECSGMANPGPIASLFWLDEGLSRLRLDGIVTLVDAAHLERQLGATKEAAQQIAYADRILLNKVDLVDEASALRLHNLIRTIHPTAPIRRTQFSAVPDLKWVLDTSCFDVDRVKDVDRALNEIEYCSDHSHQHDHGKEATCSICFAHKHTASVSTLAIVEEGSVDLRKLDQWLASLLWPNQDEQDKVLRARLDGVETTHAARPRSVESIVSSTTELYRIKGILSVGYNMDYTAINADAAVEFTDDHGLDSRRFIVQAVHDLWETHPASRELRWDSEEVRDCKVVFIGRNLKKEDLRKGFLSCMLP
jgi:G3E family GTPase